MTAEQESQRESKFNFFAVLEDTISGVVEFFLRFFAVTVFCIFRPRRCMSGYRSAKLLPSGVFPSPYTYLIICVFLFLKGFDWIDKIAPRGDEASVPQGRFLVALHDAIEKLGEVTTLQIVLSVFPTIVVILALSAVVTLLLRRFTKADFRNTSYAFSYIFGSQIVGALVLIALVANAPRLGSSDWVMWASLGVFLAGALWLVVAASLALGAWFGLGTEKRWAVIANHLICGVLVVGIAFLYFNTIAAAYFRLHPQASIAVETGELPVVAPQAVKKDLGVTLYRTTLKKDTATYSILLDNKSEAVYFVHNRASAMVMSVSDKVFEELMKKIDKMEGNTQEERLAVIKNYFKKLSVGYFRIDLALEDRADLQGRLIQPGESHFLRYKGSLQGRRILTDELNGEIMFPVARVNPDGSLSYAIVKKQFGAGNLDLEEGLERQRAKLEGNMDEQIHRMQEMFDSILSKMAEPEQGMGGDKQGEGKK
jgi:hypothetical protein